MKQQNFIVAKLCDNDFGYHIKLALEEGVKEYGYDKKLCPFLWKKFIVSYVVGLNMLRHLEYSGSTDINWNEAQSLSKYLQGMRVTIDEEKPTEDHDGGSAAIDLNTGYAWTF